MTTQTPGEKALATVNAQLMQARANDRALNPRPVPPRSLEELLGQARQSGPRHRYPTAVHVQALAKVKSMPRFMEAFHAAHCSAGVIVIEVDGRFDDTPCSRCQQTRREAQLRAQLVASGVDGRYLETEWGDLELLPPLDRVAEKCQDIGALIKAGASLLLHSEQTGSGKTQAAMLAAKAAIRAGHTAHVVNLARLALDVRESYRDKSGELVTEKAALLRLTTPDLLVIDDLGAGESDTAAVERRLLFLALDERQMRRLPTIVTTNLPLTVPEGSKTTSLPGVFGARILARLQPLKTLHVNHGTNFRARKSEVSW